MTRPKKPKPRVYNKYHKDAPPDAVYIGRPGPWGNPFTIGNQGTREEVIQKYRELVESDTFLQKRIRKELRGKDLLCFCYPAPCHGDVLLEVANGKR